MTDEVDVARRFLRSDLGGDLSRAQEAILAAITTRTSLHRLGATPRSAAPTLLTRIQFP